MKTAFTDSHLLYPNNLHIAEFQQTYSCLITGRGDAGDSVVGVHGLLAAVPGHHHLRRVSTQQARPGQLRASSYSRFVIDKLGKFYSVMRQRTKWKKKKQTFSFSLTWRKDNIKYS